MDSMFDMTEVFDASDLFWEFVKSVNDNTYDQLICTDTFSDFCQGIQSQNSLGLEFKTIFDSDLDLLLLSTDLRQCVFFDDATNYFVFRSISQLLYEVDMIYSKVMSTPCHYQEQYDCVQKYAPRASMINNCIKKIRSEMLIQESENLFESLRL